MGQKTGIEWTDATWTPLRARVRADALDIATTKGYTSLLPIIKPGRVGPHCEHVSLGCENCYSETNNGRCLTHNGTGLPFDRRVRDLVDPFVDEKILQQPLHWKKPRKIFVCSQTDLFGEWVTDEMIDDVFAITVQCPQHTFQVLTKRPERMLHVMTKVVRTQKFWPMPNVWLGVSCENQATADERIPLLLQTPAAVRFISYEPALEKVDFYQWLGGKWIDQIIIGAESGRGARPFSEDWARSTRDQCINAGTAFFYKQNAINGHKIPTPELDGRRWTDFPAAS